METHGKNITLEKQQEGKHTCICDHTETHTNTHTHQLQHEN